MNRIISVSFCAYCLLCVVPFGVEAGNEDVMKGERLEKATQWAMAAQNREMAAATQQDQAQRMLESAQAWRNKGYLKESERRSHFDKAGDLEKTAGDLLGAAFVNLDKAAANWQSVVELYRLAGEREKEEEAKASLEDAKRAAIDVCQRAAEAYEMAAQAYSPINADQSMKESQASEKAAQFRELLAARQR